MLQQIIEVISRLIQNLIDFPSDLLNGCSHIHRRNIEQHRCDIAITTDSNIDAVGRRIEEHPGVGISAQGVLKWNGTRRIRKQNGTVLSTMGEHIHGCIRQ
ncbi:hypothetical protein D3C86_2012860 [compost metagenome]